MPQTRVETAVRVLQYVVVLVLTAQATIGGAALLLWRPGNVAAPVGILVALLIAPACWWGASLLRHRAGAVGPLLVWLVIVLQMMYQRREGDLFVASDGKGLAFLLVGSVGAFAATGGWAPGTSLAVLVRRRTARGGVTAG